MSEGAKIKDSHAMCNHCDTQMVLLKVKKHPGKWPWVLIGLGVVAFFFIHFGGPIVGIPMFLLGIYMIMSDQVISMCPKCGFHFDVLVVRKTA